MREHGVVWSAGELGLQNHACWPFAGPEELREETAAFLTEGRRLGQRLMYVGAAPQDKLRADLERLADADEMFEQGSLVALSLDSMYPAGGPVDPDAQVAAYDAATKEALASGFTGLRVAADVTSIVCDPATWEAHTRWEIAADRYIASHPVCALCCYDRSETPGELLDDMRCVHPVVRADGKRLTFQLFAEPGGLAVNGEVDYFTTESFDRLLALADEHDGDVELDLTELQFADHHAILALAAHTRRLRESGRRVSVKGTPGLVERTCRLIEVEL